MTTMFLCEAPASVCLQRIGDRLRQTLQRIVLSVHVVEQNDRPPQLAAAAVNYSPHRCTR